MTTYQQYLQGEANKFATNYMKIRTSSKSYYENLGKVGTDWEEIIGACMIMVLFGIIILFIKLY